MSGPATTLAASAVRLLDCRAVIVTGTGGAVIAVAGAVTAAERAAAVARAADPGDRVVMTDGAWVAAVARGDDRPLGVLHVSAAAETAADPRRRQLLLVLAEYLADTLDPARLDGVGSPPFAWGTAVRAVADLGVNATSYEALIGGLTAAVAPLVGACRLGVGLWHEDREYLRLLPGSYSATAASTDSAQISASDPRSGAARVHRTGRARIANDPRADIPFYGEWLVDMGIERLVTVPLTVGPSALGVLHVGNKLSPFDAADARVMRRMVPMVGSAVTQVRDRLELSRRGSMADVLNRVAASVAQGARVDGAEPELLQRFCRALDASMLALTFHDGTPAVRIRTAPLPRALEDRFLTVNEEIRGEARAELARPSVLGGLGWASLHVPVVLDGREAARLSLLRLPCEPFSDSERSAIVRLAELMSLAQATERYQHQRAEAERMRERQRIADDLHDHVAQLLFAGHLMLDTVLNDLQADDAVSASVRRARDLMARSQVSIREVINHVSVDHVSAGLVERLRATVRAVGEEFQISVELEIDDPDAPELEVLEDAELDALLRGTREGVVNAAKHAGSSAIDVSASVTEAGAVVITVRDTGPARRPGRSETVDGGTDVPTSGYGIAAVRRHLAEVGATLSVERGRPAGTVFRIALPQRARVREP